MWKKVLWSDEIQIYSNVSAYMLKAKMLYLYIYEKKEKSREGNICV